MYKIAVIGDYDSIYGFESLGLGIFPVRSREETAETFTKLADGEYGIIYITEAAAAQIPDLIDSCMEKPIPAVIQIPGVYGNTGAGIQGVRKTVEQAVGSDILFGGVDG